MSMTRFTATAVSVVLGASIESARAEWEWMPLNGKMGSAALVPGKPKEFAVGAQEFTPRIRFTFEGPGRLKGGRAAVLRVVLQGMRYEKDGDTEGYLSFPVDLNHSGSWLIEFSHNQAYVAPPPPGNPQLIVSPTLTGRSRLDCVRKVALVVDNAVDLNNLKVDGIALAAVGDKRSYGRVCDRIDASIALNVPISDPIWRSLRTELLKVGGGESYLRSACDTRCNLTRNELEEACSVADKSLGVFQGMCGAFHYRCGRLGGKKAAAIAHFDAAAKSFEAIGSLTKLFSPILPWVEMAWLYKDSGDWLAAEKCLWQCEVFAAKEGKPIGGIRKWVLCKAQLSLLRGDNLAALKTLDSWPTLAGAENTPVEKAILAARQKAETLLDRQNNAVRVEAKQFLEIVPDGGSVESIVATELAVRHQLSRGENADAERRAGRLVELCVKEMLGPQFYCVAHYLAAEVAMARGDALGAFREYRQAIDRRALDCAEHRDFLSRHEYPTSLAHWRAFEEGGGIVAAAVATRDTNLIDEAFRIIITKCQAHGRIEEAAHRGPAELAAIGNVLAGKAEAAMVQGLMARLGADRSLLLLVPSIPSSVGMRGLKAIEREGRILALVARSEGGKLQVLATDLGSANLWGSLRDWLAYSRDPRAKVPSEARRRLVSAWMEIAKLLGSRKRVIVYSPFGLVFSLAGLPADENGRFVVQDGFSFSQIPSVEFLLAADAHARARAGDRKMRVIHSVAFGPRRPSAVANRPAWTPHYVKWLGNAKPIRDVDVIWREFGRPGMECDQLTAEEVTKPRCSELLDTQDELVFATHCLAEPDPRAINADVPCLLLAGCNAEKWSGETPASIWGEREIARHRQCKVRFVLLASCLSSVGPFTPGEGYCSLGRGFLLVGARSVVCSRVEIAPRSAAGIIKSLQSYRSGFNGNPGMAVPEALAQAQRDYLTVHAIGRDAANSNQHPFYWAGSIALGDPDFVE